MKRCPQKIVKITKGMHKAKGKTEEARTLPHTHTSIKPKHICFTQQQISEEKKLVQFMQKFLKLLFQF